MPILVTGAAGFIGYHVARALLARGDPVVGIDNLCPYYDVALKKARVAGLAEQYGDRFAFHRLDFARAGALDSALGGTEIDRIVHLGAQAGVRYSLENPAAYVTSNLVGHFNVLEFARSRKVAHLVYASSSSVYGDGCTLPFRLGDCTDQPASLYAATKKADELMSESYSSMFRIPMTGLRFFTVYGPWGRPDMAVWLFTKAIFAGEPLQLFNAGAMRRDFTYVDDIAGGVLACLDSPPKDDGQTKPGGSRSPHAVYNLGNNRSEDLLRLVSILEDAVGRKARLTMKPMQVGDVHDTFADISAVRRDHGFEPRTTIDEGVPLFVQWFKTYHCVA